MAMLCSCLNFSFFYAGILKFRSVKKLLIEIETRYGYFFEIEREDP